MLKRRAAALLTAVLLLVAGAGGARAALVPTLANPPHGECTFQNLAASVSGRNLTATGTGSCIANGVFTSGTLSLNATFDLDTCAVRSGSGGATLSLQGGFAVMSGSTRVVTTGSAVTVAVVGSFSGGASLIDAFRSTTLCPTVMSWTGTLAF